LIAFGPATETNPLADDTDFFRRIDWDPAAPKALRRSAQTGDWQRAVRLLLAPFGGAKSTATSAAAAGKLALWSLHDLECSPRAARLVAAWKAFRAYPATSSAARSKRKNARRVRTAAAARKNATPTAQLSAALDEWLVARDVTAPVQPLELLVLLEALRDAAQDLSLEQAARLWRAVLESCLARFSKAAPSVGDEPATARTHLAAIAREAELSWQAGLLFAPVAGSSALRDAGRAAFGQLIADATDAAGVPVAGALADLPSWMTSLVRAREWGRHFGRPLFSPSQEKRLRGVVTAVAKVCRDDGRPALVNGEVNGLVQVWSTAASALPPRGQQVSPAASYLRSLADGVNGSATRRGTSRNGSQRSGRARNGRASNGHLPKGAAWPVFQSDESRLACLRDGWSPSASSIVVAHDRHFPTLEMAVGGTTLFAGDWEIEVRLDGRTVEPADWSCVCWQSDDDGDYFELQSRPDGLRIERQIFLSRTDDFALLADVVVADPETVGRAAKLESTSRWTLVPDAALIAQTRTRESRLLFGGPTARAFPLGLNCSRVEGVSGHLIGVDGRAELSQTGIGGLYAPLVIDWNPRRRRSPAAWRRLTVAYAGAAVPSGEAAGYLLEVGPLKWMYYRSLLPALEPRSVLGQHTMYESLVGRFVRGDLEPLVQVEHSTGQAAESGE
jgi:hypothetical protein